MSVRPAPYRPVDAPGGDADTHLRILTFHFGRRNPGPVNPILAAKANDGDRMFRSEADGIFYPTTRQTTDGEGRKVADFQHTERMNWIL